MIGVIGVVLLLILILSKVSVGLALLLVGFIGTIWINGLDSALSQLGSSTFGVANNYSLTVIPLFVFMGMLLSNTGLGKELFVTVEKWIGHFRGGLAVATIGAAAIFSSISGSANATTATLTNICVPEMREYKYKTTFSTAAVAAGGTLGSLIPPSVLLILYGALTSEAIGPLLIGGLVPGILMAIAFFIMINIQVRLDPSIAPRSVEDYTWKDRIISLKNVWAFLVIFLLSIGGIYFGFFTPTEAGGVGALGAFLLTLFTKRLNFKTLINSLQETVRISVMIFLILVGAGLFGTFLALSRIPMYLSSIVGTLDYSPYIILIMILLVLFLLGMFLEGIAIMVLTLPIIYPLIIQLGFDGLWFGVIMIMMINIGVLTPPLGLSVFIISSIVKEVPIEKIFKGVIPVIVTMVLFIIILIIFPEIVTFLPSLSG